MPALVRCFHFDALLFLALLSAPFVAHHLSSLPPPTHLSSLLIPAFSLPIPSYSSFTAYRLLLLRPLLPLLRLPSSSSASPLTRRPMREKPMSAYQMPKPTRARTVKRTRMIIAIVMFA